MYEGRVEIEELYFAKAEKKLESLPDYVARWYRNLRASYKTAKTCRDYIYKVSNFLESINKNAKEVKPEQITEDTVNAYMISKTTKVKNNSKTKTSDSYKNTVWYALRSFLDYMVDQKLIEKNYILKLDKAKNHDLERINKHRTLLTHEDFKMILSCVNDEYSRYPERDKAILLLFMCTGMRKSALSSINIEDIDFENRRLYVVDKGDVEHEYRLKDSVIDALNTWIKKRKSFTNADLSDALFISNLGNRISESELETMIKRYTSKALSKPLSPHKLRSGFISIVYNKTGDIEEARRMVGHKGLSTTQRYIVTEGDEKEKAASIMEELLA